MQQNVSSVDANEIELYHFDCSTCSQKVRLVLAEKNLSFKNCHLNLIANEHLTEEYLALNPNGVVPTLVHHGRPVVDSSAIVEYLDEVFPNPLLVPDDPFLRAEMRAWMRYLEEVSTAAIRYPSFQKVLIKGYQNMTPDQFETEASARPLRADFYRKMGQDGFSSEEYNDSLNKLRLTAERMDQALENGSWLVSNKYSLADIIVTPTFDRMADLDLMEIWSDLPRVVDWWSRIKSRLNFAKAFYPGSRLSERNVKKKSINI